MVLGEAEEPPPPSGSDSMRDVCSHLLVSGVLPGLFFNLQLSVSLFLLSMNAEHLERELG